MNIRFRRFAFSFIVIPAVIVVAFLMSTTETGRGELEVAAITARDTKLSTQIADAETTPSSHEPVNTVTPLSPTHIPQSQMPISISDRTMAIYRAGVADGNDPAMFTTVGDCITAIHPFMVGFDSGEYNLGEYGELQTAVDHFEGSFGRGSQASGNNFSTATVLDPMWANDRICEVGETPLACEYRLTNPSVAIIMLGTNDVARYSVDVYEEFLTGIVDYTIEQNIVPVLTTFPTLPNYYATQSERFNAVVIELAATYDIPLIDFRSAVVDLPNHGMNTDGLHPSNRGDTFIDFRGEQYRYGMTMRDLITLQMLDAIVRSAD